MKLAVVMILSVLGISQSCPAAARTDDLCKPLRAFVESIQPGEKRSIEFSTSWGENFKDEAEPAFLAKRCDHHDYVPAKSVCRNLMNHGLVEFSNKNAQEAITCLSPKTRFDSRFSFSRIEASFPYGTKNHRSRIDIAFGWSVEIGGMILKIDVDGH